MRKKATNDKFYSKTQRITPLHLVRIEFFPEGIILCRRLKKIPLNSNNVHQMWKILGNSHSSPSRKESSGLIYFFKEHNCYTPCKMSVGW